MRIFLRAPKIMFACVCSTALLSVIWIKAVAQSTTCSGVQAGNEQATATTTPPKNVFVAGDQNFHVNVNAITDALSTDQAADIINGIRSWAGVSGISFTFDSSPPGPGVITVQLGSGFHSDEQGQDSYGGTGFAANQISGGTLSFQLNYMTSCSTGPCLAYDPNAPNARPYLQGTAAHGMGHVLGLDDTSDAGSCQATSNSVMGGQCGTNNNGDGTSGPVPTSNGPTSCDKANVMNQTTNNSSHSGGGSGGGPAGNGGGAGGDNGGCPNPLENCGSGGSKIA